MEKMGLCPLNPNASENRPRFQNKRQSELVQIPPESSR